MITVWIEYSVILYPKNPVFLFQPGRGKNDATVTLRIRTVPRVPAAMARAV
jgi:hypothetical protein